MKKAKEYAQEYIEKVFQKKENKEFVLGDTLIFGFFKDFEAIRKARNIDAVFGTNETVIPILKELNAKWHSMATRINKHIVSVSSGPETITIINPDGYKNHMIAIMPELQNMSW
ncbi:MAG: hypothetical protein WC976_06620 [Caldisericia bacterium]